MSLYKQPVCERQFDFETIVSQILQEMVGELDVLSMVSFMDILAEMVNSDFEIVAVLGIDVSGRLASGFTDGSVDERKEALEGASGSAKVTMIPATSPLGNWAVLIDARSFCE